MSWKFVFYPGFGKFKDLRDAAETCFKSGYKFICWNGMIYFVIKNDTYYICTDTNITIEDLY